MLKRSWAELLVQCLNLPAVFRRHARPFEIQAHRCLLDRLRPVRVVRGQDTIGHRRYVIHKAQAYESAYSARQVFLRGHAQIIFATSHIDQTLEACSIVFDQLGSSRRSPVLEGRSTSLSLRASESREMPCLQSFLEGGESNSSAFWIARRECIVDHLQTLDRWCFSSGEINLEQGSEKTGCVIADFFLVLSHCEIQQQLGCTLKGLLKETELFQCPHKPPPSSLNPA